MDYSGGIGGAIGGAIVFFMLLGSPVDASQLDIQKYDTAKYELKI